jgi:hypothetical protein
MEIRKSGLLPTESPAVPAGLAERGAQTATPLVAGADRSSIKALDVPAALQILVAEVQLSLTEAGFESLTAGAPLRSAAPLSTTAAAPALVGQFLRLIPQDDATPQAAWNAAVERVLQAISRGSGAAIERVIAWRDTPPTVAATLLEVRTLALAVISGEQAALLSRPEWLGLGASLQRLRQRRRRALLVTDTDADHLDLPARDEPPLPRGGRR